MSSRTQSVQAIVETLAKKKSFHCANHDFTVQQTHQNGLYDHKTISSAHYLEYLPPTHTLSTHSLVHSRSVQLGVPVNWQELHSPPLVTVARSLAGKLVRLQHQLGNLTEIIHYGNGDVYKISFPSTLPIKMSCRNACWVAHNKAPFRLVSGSHSSHVHVTHYNGTPKCKHIFGANVISPNSVN